MMVSSTLICKCGHPKSSHAGRYGCQEENCACFHYIWEHEIEQDEVIYFTHKDNPDLSHIEKQKFADRS